jgi:hypothetical protein
MRFTLAAEGTVTECREALNAALAALKPPFKQEHAVVRAAAHYVVEENLDALYAPWAAECNALRAAGLATKPEPRTKFSISIAIDVAEVARAE